MAEFDTTKMTQNRPELTYVTPKAMPAKFSNLGAVASLADTAIKGAVALDKRMTLTQAEQEAESEKRIAHIRRQLAPAYHPPRGSAATPPTPRRN